MEHTGRLAPEAFWSLMHQLSERVRKAAPEMPVFTVRTWSGPVMLGDWHWEDGQLVSAGLVHGQAEGDGPRVDVVTTTGDPRASLGTLRATGGQASGTSAQDVARPRHQAEIAPPTGACTLDVGGANVRFDVWAEPGWWGAVGGIDAHGLVIGARGVTVGDLALDRVTDLEPFIAGRDAQIRHARGEE